MSVVGLSSMCPKSPGGVLSVCASGSQAGRPRYGLQNLQSQGTCPDPSGSGGITWRTVTWADSHAQEKIRRSAFTREESGTPKKDESKSSRNHPPTPQPLKHTHTHKETSHRADLPSQKRKEPSECPVSLVLQDTVGDICVSTAASSAETGPP